MSVNDWIAIGLHVLGIALGLWMGWYIWGFLPAREKRIQAALDRFTDEFAQESFAAMRADRSITAVRKDARGNVTYDRRAPETLEDRE